MNSLHRAILTEVHLAGLEPGWFTRLPLTVVDRGLGSLQVSSGRFGHDEGTFPESVVTGQVLAVEWEHETCLLAVRRDIPSGRLLQVETLDREPWRPEGLPAEAQFAGGLLYRIMGADRWLYLGVKACCIWRHGLKGRLQERLPMTALTGLAAFYSMRALLDHLAALTHCGHQDWQLYQARGTLYTRLIEKEQRRLLRDR